jgi:hypothetical protein
MKNDLKKIALALLGMAIRTKKTLTAIALIFVVGGVSGCHPCSVVQCGSWAKAEVFAGDKGELYIDIPDRKKFARAELQFFGVDQIRDGKFSGCFWSISKSINPTIPQKTQPLDVSEFPLRYGGEVPGTFIEIPPKNIENGTYHIRGWVFLFGGKERHTTNITGDFSYENGVVKNLK